MDSDGHGRPPDDPTDGGTLGADFKLGEWWVRPQRNVLERGETRVQVEARSMQVLVCLARRAPDLASKAYLLSRVWRDAYVGDDVISHAIWELRKALGDSARQPTYIETIPKKGYRLICSVQRPDGSPVPLVGAQVEQYEIRAEIGRGAMGVVYEAFDHHLDRTVALKFLAPELSRDIKAVQRFTREARMAASLVHPNLATVHEVGETSQGHHYLVTPHYAGGSLQQRIQEGPVLIADAITIARQLCEGLAAAHARDIIHRDIKPANLLFDAHGTLKIGDFGVAKLLSASGLTRTGAVIGTPAYRSPEQNRSGTIDHRTDIWSAGVVLFEMLTGRRPFDGDFDPMVRHAVETARPQARETLEGQSIPEDLRAIVSRAMAKRLEDRFPDAQSMADALAALGPDGQVSVEPLLQHQVQSRASHRLWSLTAMVVVLLVLVMSQNLSVIELSRVSGQLGIKDLQTALLEQESGQSDVFRQESQLALAAGCFDFPPAIRKTLDECQEFSLPSCFDSLPEVHDRIKTCQKKWLEGSDALTLDEAQICFRRVYSVAPICSETLGHLAALLAETAALKGSRKMREEAWGLIEASENNDLFHEPMVRVAHGRLLLLENRFREAERVLGSVFEEWSHCEPNDSCDLAPSWQAEALWNLGRYGQADTILRSCEEIGGGAIRCVLKRAQLREAQDEYQEAEALYQAVLADHPKQTAALIGYGQLLIKQENYVSARRVFEELVDIVPSDPMVWIKLGDVKYYQGFYHEAIIAYEEAGQYYQAKGIMHELPHVGIGDALLELGRDAEAMFFFDKALKIYDAKSEAGFLYYPGPRAVCLAKLGEIDEAIDAIRSLRYVLPSSWWHFLAAHIYALAGHEKELFLHASKAISEGFSPSRLRQDAAFRAYRDDSAYKDLLASAGS